ncbi:general secretion pathway protein GspK [Desulfosalsimonas propionicica]|uniref:general secretion pathway protein GspK n=1 Tax=Desulfosalsimonas propionicica TaxID=332175 RepID=UPI002FC399B2
MLKANNHGIALLITLSIITVLIAVAFELNRQTGASLSRSGAGRDRQILQEKIESGVSLAMLILIRDKEQTEVDSVQEDWADPEKISGYLGRAGYDDDELQIEITDERARMQVNALVEFPAGREFDPVQQQLWLRFLELFLQQQDQPDTATAKEPLEPEMIINPIKDWIDSGDDDAITGLSGAESDHYIDQDPPYKCRNGPVRHLSELLRVRNITPERFFADDENAGLGDFLTVHGLTPAANNPQDFTYGGRININTAEIPVLAALLPTGLEFLAPEMAAFRKESSGGEYLYDLTDPTWYRQVPGMGEVEIDTSLVAVKSDLFRIRCKARHNQSSMAARVIVRREQKKSGKWKCRVLRWQYE